MKNIKIIFTIIIVFLIDQISKIIIMNNFALGEELIIIKNFFSLTYTKNYGAAFGIFENHTLFIIIVSLILFGYLIYETRKNKDKFLITLSLSFIIGGLLGNLLDRIYFGYVRDFLDFTIFGYEYAIFNLSDTFIVIGSILFILELLKEEINENKKRRIEH